MSPFKFCFVFAFLNTDIFGVWHVIFATFLFSKDAMDTPNFVEYHILVIWLVLFIIHPMSTIIKQNNPFLAFLNILCNFTYRRNMTKTTLQVTNTTDYCHKNGTPMFLQLLLGDLLRVFGLQKAKSNILYRIGNLGWNHIAKIQNN